MRVCRGCREGIWPAYILKSRAVTRGSPRVSPPRFRQSGLSANKQSHAVQSVCRGNPLDMTRRIHQEARPFVDVTGSDCGDSARDVRISQCTCDMSCAPPTSLAHKVQCYRQRCERRFIVTAANTHVQCLFPRQTAALLYECCQQIPKVA